jgi:hypothetical protein
MLSHGGGGSSKISAQWNLAPSILYDERRDDHQMGDIGMDVNGRPLACLGFVKHASISKCLVKSLSWHVESRAWLRRLIRVRW